MTQPEIKTIPETIASKQQQIDLLLEEIESLKKAWDIMSGNAHITPNSYKKPINNNKSEKRGEIAKTVRDLINGNPEKIWAPKEIADVLQRLINEGKIYTATTAERSAYTVLRAFLKSGFIKKTNRKGRPRYKKHI